MKTTNFTLNWTLRICLKYTTSFFCAWVARNSILLNWSCPVYFRVGKQPSSFLHPSGTRLWIWRKKVSQDFDTTTYTTLMHYSWMLKLAKCSTLVSEIHYRHDNLVTPYESLQYVQINFKTNFDVYSLSLLMVIKDVANSSTYPHLIRLVKISEPLWKRTEISQTFSYKT